MPRRVQIRQLALYRANEIPIWFRTIDYYRCCRSHGAGTQRATKPDGLRRTSPSCRGCSRADHRPYRSAPDRGELRDRTGRGYRPRLGKKNRIGLDQIPSTGAVPLVARRADPSVRKSALCRTCCKKAPDSGLVSAGIGRQKWTPKTQFAQLKGTLTR